MNLDMVNDFINDRIQGIPSSQNTNAPIGSPSTEPYIIITEQPAPHASRFRYECEGRSAGSMIGVNSTIGNKTYPSIQIVGYKGKARVIVSCVTKDKLQPHPHKLVGPGNSKKGYLVICIDNDTMTTKIQNVGIQCVRIKDVDDALRSREADNIDPFGKGFEHKANPNLIDLKSLRLGFEAYLFCENTKKYSIKIKPIASDIIYDKKGVSDLVICEMSSASASVRGGDKIILLCEKVPKDDIQVRFFEVGQSNWEGYADFRPSDVHKQVAITCRTPKYKTMETDGPVNVWVQLKKKSDGTCSKDYPFQFTPTDTDAIVAKRKRLSTEFDRLKKLNMISPGFIPQFDSQPLSPTPSSTMQHDYQSPCTKNSTYWQTASQKNNVRTHTETANQHGDTSFEELLNSITNAVEQFPDYPVITPDHNRDFNQLSNSYTPGQPSATTIMEAYHYSQNTIFQNDSAPKATIIPTPYPTDESNFHIMDTSNIENNDNIILAELTPLTTIDCNQSNRMNATISRSNQVFDLLDFTYETDLQERLSFGFDTSLDLPESSPRTEFDK